MATAVVTFGRMNPITVGHAKLVDKVKSVSKSVGGKPLIYLSHTQDKKKNPLSYKDKIKYARSAFGPSIQKSKARTIIEVLKELDGKYDDIVIVVGSDRVTEFDTLVNKYNKKEYTYNSIKTVSAGDRDPDADDVSGMSASKLRAAVSIGDYALFSKGTPKTLTPKEKKAMYDIIRKVLPIQENFFEENEEDDIDLDKVSDNDMEILINSMDAVAIDESVSDDDLEDIIGEDFEEEAVMSVAQRRKRALQMKRLAPKIQAKKKIAMKKMAGRAQLMKRAQKAAVAILRKKMAGKKGENYATLSTGGKIQIDKMIEKKRGSVAKIAKKLLPKMMKKEKERIKSLRGGGPKEEQVVEVSQDKDVEDRKGTQPAKYYAGDMSKSTKQARARHFEKGKGGPAPGDSSGKTKPSKHTKKYKQMFGAAMTPYVKPNPVLAMGEETQMKKFKDFVIEKRDVDPADIDRSATGADKEKADQNIIMQLRKSISLRGNKEVVFDDGKKVKISANDAQKAMNAFDKARTSIDKGKVMKLLSKSLNSFKSTIKSGYHEEVNSEADELFENFTLTERKLSPAELRRREEIAKDLPDDEFKKRYGDDWKSVKIATATKMAKNEENKLPPHLAKLFDKDGSFIGRTAKQKALIKKGKKPNIKTKHLKTLTMKDIFKDHTDLDEISTDQLIKQIIAKTTKKKPYEKAAEVLRTVINRKKKENSLKHDLAYYAGQIAKSFKGIDARALAKTYEKLYEEDKKEIFLEKKIEGLVKKSEKSKISYGILKKVFDRGMAAWKTGHRPGTTPQQWAFARVNSFITGGKTRTTADADLWAKVKR